MKADPWAQLRLLDLQAVDSAVDRLAHKRKALPELAEIEQLQARLAELRDEHARAQVEVSDIGREQTKLEVDVDAVRQRAARDQQRLDSGQVTSAKDLEHLQSEVASLARRQSSLEDDLLEVMETKEQAEARASAAARAMAETTEALADAEARLAAATAEIDAETASQREQRGPLVEGLPEELVALYEKIRASSGGVGAAALIRKRCEGCHLELAGTELSAVKAAGQDDVIRCEECRRILVRTAESGLS